MFLLLHGFLMKEVTGGKIFSNSKSVKNFQRGGSELQRSSVLNALHSLRSGLFNVAFEVLLPFKLNSSRSVATY